MSGEIRWQVRIDWDGQGIWGAAGVDASDDVLGLRWRWGRCGLPVPEFAPPAEVELTLRNHDHRYTPGNVNGPLGEQRWNRPGGVAARRLHSRRLCHSRRRVR